LNVVKYVRYEEVYLYLNLLLFSFECCLERGLIPSEWTRHLTCYFLLNVVWFSEMKPKAKKKVNLLFSFECCL